MEPTRKKTRTPPKDQHAIAKAALNALMDMYENPPLRTRKRRAPLTQGKSPKVATAPKARTRSEEKSPPSDGGHEGETDQLVDTWPDLAATNDGGPQSRKPRN